MLSVLRRLLVGLLTLSFVAALLTTTSPQAGAQNGGDIGFGGGTDRPGEPEPVNAPALSTVPARNMWGVTGVDPNRTVNYENPVWDFAVIGDRYYVAGNFLYVQEGRNTTRFNRPYLAAFDLLTGEWDPNFQPDLNGSVYALEVSPRGKLLVGGEFTSVEGRPNTEGLTSLDPVTGAYDAQWNGSVERPFTSDPAVVRSLEVVGNNLYVAGNFSHVRGNSDSQRTRVYKVARINAKWGTPDSTFKPVVAGAGVWGVGIDTVNSTMHLTGFFSSVGGQGGTNNYATVSLVDGALIPGQGGYRFNSPARPELFDVEVAGGKVWVGGSQHNVQVLNASNRSALGYHTTSFGGCNGDPLAWCNTWRGGGDYQVLEEVGDYVFAGCHCVVEYGPQGQGNHYSSFDGARFPTLLLEAYDKNSGRLVQSFVPDLAASEEGVWAVHSDPFGCLFVGGDFEVAGLKTGQSFWVGNFARFCPPGVNVGPDFQSPSTPTGLTATASGSSVSLNWNDSSDNFGVNGYNVYRDGQWIKWTPTSSYTDTGLSFGTYRYQVRAYDAAGNRSSLSNQANAAVGGADNQAPSVPVVTASVNGSTVSLNWPDSTDNLSGVQGYNVYRDGSWLRWTSTSNYTDTGVSNGAHVYEVRAYDVARNASAKSAPITVQVGPVDNQPPSLPVVSGSANGSTVSLNWANSTDASGVDGYAVYRDDAFVGWTRTSDFTDTGVANGPHTYEVRAYDTVGNRSDKSATITVQVGPVDNQPPSLPVVSGSANGSTVSLNWADSTDASGVDGYAVYRDNAFVGWTRTSDFTDTGVANGPHTYEVRAYDTVGNRSDKSATITVQVGPVDVTPPPVPAGLTATANGNSVALAWSGVNDPSGIDGYAVYRNGGYIGWSTSTTFVDNPPAGTHVYDIRAYDRAGNRSAKSAPASATV